MKSFKKTILVLGVAIGIIFSVGGAAFAGSSISDTLKGYKIRASCYISNGDASAYTSYAGSGSASVSATYTILKRATNTIKKTTRTKGNYGSASVSFEAPLDYVSTSITCEHRVSASDRSWKGNTSAYFG